MRIAIVEDDGRVQLQLKQYVLQFFAGRENQVKITLFSDGDEIVSDYRAEYDVIFLDIQMQRLDGMSTAEKIRRLDSEVYLIFITNMVNYAIKGYAVNALDFVLKPVNYLMLEQLLARVERMLDSQTKRYITVPTENGLTRLDVSQIYYVETEGHAVKLCTAKGEYRMKSSMRSAESMLGDYDFFRCNSCYLVNLAHVEQIDGSCALVAGNELTISRPRHKAFMTALTNYIGGMKA